MKFGLIHTLRQSAEHADIADLHTAYRRVGLAPGAVDHGTAADGLAVVVGEFALFVPPEQQRYFAIAGYPHLCAGPAVLHAYDGRGLGVDLPQLPRITWLPDRRAVERAIAGGLIKRPHIGMGDDVIWRWPGPRPSEEARERLMRKIVQPGVTIIDGDTIIRRIR
jgi:hypothetical protein